MTSAAAELDLRGGHPVVDFVNTVAWRGDLARRTDYLVHYSDVVAWCHHSDVISAGESATLIAAMRSDAIGAHRALARARRLRESLYAWFTCAEPPGLTAIAEAYRSALRLSELRAVDDGVAWVERQISVRTPVDRLAAGAVRLITEFPRSRVKQCGDRACGWLFLDHSHRQNRRWCSASDCGNRDRARRHYERSRTR
jgi:predicted RNA-binding Zn ribbon-like protein